ncbi:structural constituent of ribosome, partial [Bonamia ostreae]
MSSNPTKEDLSLLLKADCHIGAKTLTKKMAPYIFKKATDGKSHIIDLHKTWQKIHAAALLLVAVKNPKDICLVSSTNWGKRSIFKFSQYAKAHSISGRFTPGTFTNQICKSFREPSVLIVCDPELDNH